MIDSSSGSLALTAPLSGWVAPLSEVPDAVFSGKMMGDGIAIDPTDGNVVAPCDGKIVHLHHAHHAVTMKSLFGAEILIHVGLETVALQGRGFTMHVIEGQQVKAGELLVSFDLDLIGHEAKSLITPIIITNGEEFAIGQRFDNRAIAAGQPLLTLHRLAQQTSLADPVPQHEIIRKVIVPLAHGIHARPAARLADLAKSHDAELFLSWGQRRANAKSPVALMSLGLVKGTEVTLSARGRDADAVVAAVAALIESGMGEKEAEHHAPPAPTPEPAKAVWIAPGVAAGVRAAPGLALGVAVRLKVAEIAVIEAGQGPAYESRQLEEALGAVRALLTAASKGRGPQAAIMAAHLAFLDDPELAETANSAVTAGKSAAFAWRRAIEQQIAVLRGLSDPRFVERIADLTDIERQVLVALGCAPAEEATPLPDQAVLLADDLLPSQLVGLDTAKLAGIATVRGGPTSHVAILAASMNIPALVACGPVLEEIAAGVRLLIDADQGRLVVDPTAELIAATEAKIAERAERRAAAMVGAHKTCHTKDGVRVEIAANLGSVADAEKAVAAGAEGCGLLRTEFLFLERQSPPDEAEQAEVYGAIARVLDGRPLVIRTLDIGGDKPAAYLPIPEEENPALGLRGVRISLWKPDLFEIQLRAILKSVPAAQCRIMLPMIASLSEFREAKALMERVKAELKIEEKIEFGIMVETPAAAITADILAAEADFLSVGTNDLSQYTLAMDRGNASVAAQIDALHPAVLRLIEKAAEGGARHGRWTGVCGGLASDLAAVPILIGLGVRELSATANQVADIKALVSGMTLEDCQALAQRALVATSPAEVRALAAKGDK
ncbi:MAG TPA: phosphoenolpyruvate--protein phosphotransferase [Magnetospirillaceae bacterium]|nr:phosphoenolpyruvate--protein phosphotransferase [Magnetospirillaceae bacterium]